MTSCLAKIFKLHQSSITLHMAYTHCALSVRYALRHEQVGKDQNERFLQVSTACRYGIRTKDYTEIIIV